MNPNDTLLQDLSDRYLMGHEIRSHPIPLRQFTWTSGSQIPKTINPLLSRPCLIHGFLWDVPLCQEWSRRVGNSGILAISGMLKSNKTHHTHPRLGMHRCASSKMGWSISRNSNVGSPMLSSCFYIYIYIYICCLMSM